MSTQKMVGIKMQTGMWVVVPIVVNNADVIPLNLDQQFPGSATSIRFKGISLNGRLLYHETDLPRTSR